MRNRYLRLQKKKATEAGTKETLTSEDLAEVHDTSYPSPHTTHPTHPRTEAYITSYPASPQGSRWDWGAPGRSRRPPTSYILHTLTRLNPPRKATSCILHPTYILHQAVPNKNGHILHPTSYILHTLIRLNPPRKATSYILHPTSILHQAVPNKNGHILHPTSYMHPTPG